MKKTDAKNFRDGINRFYRRSAKLNLYIQNCRSPDCVRITAELKALSTKLNKLSTQITAQGECVLKD